MQLVFKSLKEGVKMSIETYNKLKKLHEQAYDYTAKVDAHFYFDEPGISADSVHVAVPFGIETEFRSWGLKDIYINLPPEVEIDLEPMDEQGNTKPITIKVDLTELPQEWVRGGGYAPLEMSLHLNRAGVVDYKKSYIELMYLKKD